MFEVLLSFALLTFELKAEYRAFRLGITKDGITREVITNFDHYQYPQIYSLDSSENVHYIESWMCWGRQGEGVPICPNSKNTQPTSGTAPRAPAALE